MPLQLPKSVKKAVEMMVRRHEIDGHPMPDSPELNLAEQILAKMRNEDIATAKDEAMNSLRAPASFIRDEHVPLETIELIPTQFEQVADETVAHATDEHNRRQQRLNDAETIVRTIEARDGVTEADLTQREAMKIYTLIAILIELTIAAFVIFTSGTVSGGFIGSFFMAALIPLAVGLIAWVVGDIALRRLSNLEVKS